MNAFYRWSAGYLLISGVLYGGLVVQNYLIGRLFRKEFPGRKTPGELDEEEMLQWTCMADTRFGHGPWRWLQVVFMIYHYPGFLISVRRGGTTLSTNTMFFGSMVVWLGVIALLTQPWAGK